jgi:hypothetical protein
LLTNRIYNSLIQPLFDYCDVVWDSLPAAAGASILQNRAARVITRQGYDVRSNEIRDKSLLMPGRGPEEIFMNSKNFS